MHSVVRKEAGTSMNVNARNSGGERRGRNYSRGRPRRNALTISDFMEQALVDKLSTVPADAPRRRRRGGRNQRKQLGPRETQIEDLNDDCLIHVFSFLPIVDRVRIQRVSKRWYSVSLLTWKTLKEINLKEDFWGVHYNKSKVTVDRVALHRVLELCGRYLTHIDLTKDIIGRIPRVRIESCKAVLKIIEETCPNLRSLNIEKPTSASALDYIADYLFKITGITMEVSTYNDLYQWSVINLLSMCKGLKYLKLTNSKISSNCLLDSKFEHLEELHLYNCEFEDAESILNVIDRLKTLNTLSIEHGYGKTEWEPEVLQALSSLTNLKKLNLEMSSYLCESIETDFISYLTNLEELKLGGYGVANDEILDKISRKCRNIRKLQLVSSNLVTDESISYIAKFPHLEYLRLDTLNSLICENLEKVSQIKYLECKDCMHMKNEGFANLIASSKNIRIIKILNCDLTSEELIVKANNIASEKLYLILDNSRISRRLVNNIHSLNKNENQTIKKFEKQCIECFKVRAKDCKNCYNKVEVC